MTLKEIAEEVGVSISTVSRVVNPRNPHAASPELQQAIWECVRKYGYVPSSSKNKLNESKNNSHKPVRLIACVFARNSKSVNENTYFSGMAKCFEKTALALHYSTGNYFTAIELSEINLETITDRHLDGIVVLGRHDRNLIEKIESVVENIVYAGLAHPAADHYDVVICDRHDIGVKAAEYLCNLGHRRIAYLGETFEEITFDGFLEVIRKNGIEFPDCYQEIAENSMEQGYNGMKKLISLKNRPTAVFCMNDYVALGALRAVHESGLKCPKDISILGVDDIESTNYSTPRLTTIHTPMEELGTIASKVLIDRIEGGHLIPLKVTLPFTLIERESCCPPKSIE